MLRLGYRKSTAFLKLSAHPGFGSRHSIDFAHYPLEAANPFSEAFAEFGKNSATILRYRARYLG
jgi:hypothetical protein